MEDRTQDRRRLLSGAGIIAASLAFAGAAAAKPTKENKKVGAVEDLMREHGVIRRAILVYRESAAKLRTDPNSVDPSALKQTAILFRSFAEDYHERQLEEAHIFPAVRAAGGPAAAAIDVLLAQHARGRAVTDYVLAVLAGNALAQSDGVPLALAFENFELMYANHAAREDTIVFPAWKEALSAHALDEMGERFENIERRMFGHDGFEDAVRKIGEIEQTLGFGDLAQFTAPAPPGR